MYVMKGSINRITEFLLCEINELVRLIFVLQYENYQERFQEDDAKHNNNKADAPSLKRQYQCYANGVVSRIPQLSNEIANFDGFLSG